MATVYCIRSNGEVFLSWVEYIRYCNDKGIKPQYEATD